MSEIPRLPDGRINWRKIKFKNFPMNAERTMLAERQRAWASKRLAEEREANRTKRVFGKTELSNRQVQYMLTMMGREAPFSANVERGDGIRELHDLMKEEANA